MSTDRNTRTQLDSAIEAYQALSQGLDEWKIAPIYFEPVQFSGERITCAIIAVNDNEYRLIDIFGGKSSLNQTHFSALKNLSGMVCGSLGEHLQDDGAMEDWSPIFSGIEVGEFRTGATDSIEKLISSLRSSYSFFAGDGEIIKNSQQSSRYTAKGWNNAVKQIVLSKKQQYKDRFDKSFSIREDAHQTKIGYVGQKYAINFSALPATSNSLASSTHMSISKIATLSAFAKQIEGPLTVDSDPVLSLWIPPFKSLTSSEKKNLHSHIEEISGFADINEVELATHHTPEEAAKMIFSD